MEHFLPLPLYFPPCYDTGMAIPQLSLPFFSELKIMIEFEPSIFLPQTKSLYKLCIETIKDNLHIIDINDLPEDLIHDIQSYPEEVVI